MNPDGELLGISIMQDNNEYVTQTFCYEFTHSWSRRTFGSDLFFPGVGYMPWEIYCKVIEKIQREAN